VAVVDGPSGRSLLKWSGAENEHAEKLREEAAFYRTSDDSSYLPRYLSSGANFLEIEYVESTSLRHWLLNHDASPGELQTLFAAYADILDSIARVEQRKDISEKDLNLLQGSLNKLLLSGPMDAAPTPANKELAESYRKELSVVTRAYIKDKLSSAQDKLGQATIHGDFHLNNILVGPSGRLIVVDWENRRIGANLNDALYSAAMFYQLLDNADAQRQFAERLRKCQVLSDSNVRGVFFDLLDVFCDVIESNPRFHRTVRPESIARAHLHLAHAARNQSYNVRQQRFEDVRG
jgi:hypothetical protein